MYNWKDINEEIEDGILLVESLVRVTRCNKYGVSEVTWAEIYYSKESCKYSMQTFDVIEMWDENWHKGTYNELREKAENIFKC